MAIARLSMKVGKAGKAGPHAAYIAREGQYANRLERGERLEATEAGNMPAWAQSNPLAFWQAADAYERKNGTTYREMEIALPRELDADQRAALVREFVRQEIGDRHAYQWAIHVPTAADGGEQPHVHLMFSERQRDGIERDPEQYFKRYNAKAPEKGGARKGYGPSAGKTLTKAERAAELKELRGRWEAMCNAHLERAGLEQRIDMRSHAERGTGLEPERKQLPSQWRGQGRANVIEFRQARAELAEARQELARAVPDARAEVIHLEAERQRRDAERQFEAMPAAELVEKWDTTTKELAKGYRQRADRLEHRLRTEIHDIGDKRYRAQVDHAEKRPAEVKDTLWNRITGKVAEYGKALADWQGTMKRIEGWKQRREADLMRRLKRLEGYLSRTHYGYRDKATIKAERTLARKYPAWAQRVPAAREQVAAERAQQRALQQAAQGMAKQIVSLAAAHQKGRVQGVSRELGRVLDAVNAMPGRSSQKAATLAAELRERPDLMQTYQPLLAPHQRTLQRSRGGMER